jgi:hypothetical protein
MLLILRPSTLECILTTSVQLLQRGLALCRSSPKLNPDRDDSEAEFTGINAVGQPWTSFKEIAGLKEHPGTSRSSYGFLKPLKGSVRYGALLSNKVVRH